MISAFYLSRKPTYTVPHSPVAQKSFFIKSYENIFLFYLSYPSLIPYTKKQKQVFLYQLFRSEYNVKGCILHSVQEKNILNKTSCYG